MSGACNIFASWLDLIGWSVGMVSGVALALGALWITVYTGRTDP